MEEHNVQGPRLLARLRILTDSSEIFLALEGLHRLTESIPVIEESIVNLWKSRLRSKRKQKRDAGLSFHSFTSF